MPILQNFALYQQQRTFLPALRGRVDGFPREEHQLSIASTENPVESGSTITDNAVQKRAKLRLEGWVSDLIPAPGVEFSADRATGVWGEIDAIMARRELITAVTPLRVYRNMIIARVTAPVDRFTGRALRFTIDLQEILIARTSTAMFPEGSVDENGPAAGRTSSVDRGDVASRPYPNVDMASLAF